MSDFARGHEWSQWADESFKSGQAAVFYNINHLDIIDSKCVSTQLTLQLVTVLVQRMALNPQMF